MENTELERMRIELAKTTAERDALKAQLAERVAPKAPAGKKYKITLRNAHTLVVEPRPGEHPWDAAKRIGGIQGSVNKPEIGEAAEHEECGIYHPNTGKLIRAFPKDVPTQAA